jgi:signal transduction histidine kinase/CheY-like chemotaxis protein
MNRCLLTRLFLALALLLAPAVASAQDATSAQLDAAVADAKSSMLVDPQKAIIKAKDIRLIASRLPDKERIAGIATAQWLEGEAHLRLNDPKPAGPLIDAALASLGNGPPSKLKGDLLVSRGGYHTATANVASALADYQSAFTMYRAIGQTRSEAIALSSIAGLYIDANDYGSALKYYGQALDVYRGDPQFLVSIYNNRGNALTELKRYPEAESQFREALKIARSLDSRMLVAQILRNIARNELNAGDLTAADRTITEGFALLRQGDDDAFTPQFWAVAAQAALQRGNLQNARVLIERTFAKVDPDQQTVVYWPAHKTAFEIYDRLGDTQQALLHLQALKKIDDQTTSLAISTNTALMAARFDFANQELKISRLQAQEAKRRLEYERARARTQLWIFIGSAVTAAGVVAMLGFGLITIRRSRNEVRAANVDLASTNTALAKALAAKTEFLATTSHEIRTPLNGILGMTQVMLADAKLDERVRDRIGVVHGAGISMRALVDDILDVAKMETGNLTIERAPVDLPAMLKDVSRMWEDQARAKHIGFDLDLSKAPSRIESDPARLRQVVFNLLSNALKFTQDGSIHVACEEQVATEGDRLAVVIRDTGIGIPPEKLELIFESFRQADAGTTRQFGGTGLGLAICRNIARAMGGDVTVESAVGEGSTFTLLVPLVRLPEEAPMAAGSSGESALLIVDRNPISRSMLKTLFAARVTNVSVCGSVADAVATIASGGVARIVIDEATLTAEGEADAQLATLAGVPLTVLWTNPDDDIRARFSALGVDQLVEKPITGVALVAKVASEPVTQNEPIDSHAA